MSELVVTVANVIIWPCAVFAYLDYRDARRHLAELKRRSK